MSKKRVRRTNGDVLAIPLGEKCFGYGRVLPEPLIAFYDLKSSEILPIERILNASMTFVLFVTSNALVDGSWTVIGNAPLPPELLREPIFFKKDVISGALTSYRDSTGEQFPLTKEQCKDLECAAVWDPDHVVDRLQDHFAGRPNKWVISMRP